MLNVSSGREAIWELSKGGVDVLVTAAELPDIDAWRLTRMIRSGRFCSRTQPVVVLSAGHATKILEAIASEHGITVVGLGEDTQLISAINAAIMRHNKSTLLAIEDDKRAADLLDDSLGADFDVDLAYNGEAGLSAWKARRHHLVVLDFMLPGISGAEVLQQMLSISPTQPVVILTAHATADTHQDLVLAGAADFVAKPYEVEQLRRTCESVLRHSELMETCAEFRETKGVMHHITNRVYAAERCLSVGKAWMASRHLKSALTVCRNASPNDTEWDRIINECDP